MKKSIDQYIKEVYVEKKYHLLYEKYKIKLEFVEDIIKDLKSCFINYSSHSSYCYGKTWVIDFKNFENIEYKTKIYISQIAPVYFIFHCIEYHNNYADSTEKNIESFETFPYIRSQEKFHSLFSEKMNKYNYIEYQDSNEGIIEFKNNTFSLMGGEQYTAFDIFFNDVFNLLNHKRS